MRWMCLTLAVVLTGCARERVEAPPVQVLLETTMGDIVLELDPEHAPVSTANFLAYVDAGTYDDTIFHRVVPGFVIQGGGHTRDLTELPGADPIVNEWTNGLKNVRGAIGMAREADPDSATRQWYINTADNERLDRARDVSGNAGYAVFGRVTSGMEVVDRIEAARTFDRVDLDLRNIPVRPIVLERATRIP